MEDYVNPRGALQAEMDRLEAEERKKVSRFPSEPEKDILLFLLEHGKLEPWQRDVLAIIRDEAYYFAPQGQTKIMNEGWASYWHSTIMCERTLTDSEIVDFADHHSGTTAMPPGSFNPYKVGLELFRDIEDRWNKGGSAKSTMIATTTKQRRTGTKGWGGAAKRSLRFAESTTTSLHRYIPHRGFLPAASTLQLRLQPRGGSV